MHRHTHHHRHLGQRSRVIAFTRDVDYAGGHGSAGEVATVPVHIADALIRAGCAALHTPGAEPGLQNAAPSAATSDPGSAPISRRKGKRHKVNDGDSR